jgi:transposase
MSPEHLVFVDETWAKTNMARCYGRAPRGRRLVAAIPHGHWKTSTFLAGLRRDGITAPCVLDGPINGRSFRAWVEQFLAPTLRHGDVVILDNLSSHKVAGIRNAIEARGATVRYLPPYSPDLNPIEQTFAKLKAGLRKAAARCRDDLWAAIGRALDTITPTECRNYLAHAGYASI